MSNNKRQSPRSDKDLLLETMIEAASNDDTMDAFLKNNNVQGSGVDEEDDDETTIEFGLEEDLIALDHYGHTLNPMFQLKRNLDQDFCDSSTDSYWEDEKKRQSTTNKGPKWDVTLANSVQVLKSQLRESSESSLRWTGKTTVPESPQFHEIHHRPLPKSTQEQEEDEMNEIKPFKARNTPRLETPKLDTKPAPTTTPQPFHFHSTTTTTRKRPVHVPPSKEEMDWKECEYRFKARPIPKSLQLVSKTPASRIPPPKASRVPRTASPPTTRSAEFRSARTNAQASNVEKVCVEFEVKTMRVEFYMKEEEKGKKKKTTTELQVTDAPVQSFHLNCLERHEAFQQKQAEKKKEEENKNRQMACFKARPLPASMKRPPAALVACRTKSRVTKSVGKANQKTISAVPVTKAKSSSTMTTTQKAGSTIVDPSPPPPAPNSPKKVSRTEEIEDDLTMFLDAEQPKANSRAFCVMVRLIKVTSTVMILPFVVLCWKNSGRDAIAHAKRTFQDLDWLARHPVNREILHSFSPSSVVTKVDNTPAELYEIPSIADAEVMSNNEIIAPEVNRLYEREREREPVVREIPHLSDIQEDHPAIAVEPVEAQGQDSTASSQLDAESTLRDEMPVSRTADWNGGVSSKYVMNFVANDPYYESNLSIDTVRNTGMSEKMPRESQLVSSRKEFAPTVREEYADVALKSPDHLSGIDFAAPTLPKPIQSQEPEGNKTTVRATKTATRSAPDVDYFEGRTLEDPETLRNARDHGERMAAKNTTTGDDESPLERTETHVDETVPVVAGHLASELQDGPESVLGTERIQSGAMYFDFLEGFVPEDRYLQRRKGRAPRQGRAEQQEATQEMKKPARVDYHVQRWLDLSVDEMTVLNGIFGVRLDSSFKKDVYRMHPNHL